MADIPVMFRIMAGVVAACLGMGLILLVGLSDLSRLRDGGQVMKAQAIDPAVRLDELHRAYLQTRIDALADEWVADTNGVEHQAYLADIQAMDAAIASLAKLQLDAEQLAALSTLKDAWVRYQKVVSSEAFLRLARSGDKAAYVAIRDAQAKPAAVQIQASLSTLWARLAHKTQAQIQTNENTFSSARTTSLIVFLGALAIAGALSVVAARSVIRPLRRLGEVCQEVAAGDLTRVAGLTGKDEICQVANALDRATASTRETVSALAGATRSMADATVDLTASTSAIAASAHETSQEVEGATAAADEVSSNVQSVAAGAEEMSASINEIARNASEAAGLGADTRDLTEATTATMAKLGESSIEIGNVVQVITAIAAQTNLLALNATIESARAGAAGKGFAVVANEVKELARETVRATEEIGRQVQTIQTDSAGAVQAIDRISEMITRLGDVQSTIASAVEEQTATTAEMSRSVAEASSQTALIADNMTRVNNAATETAGSAEHTRGVTGQLVQLSEDLGVLVSKFRS